MIKEQLRTEGGQGTIVGEKESFCEWNMISNRAFYEYFCEFKRVYVESMHCPNLVEIYKRCVPAIPIQFIDEEDCLEIEDCLLIWENDVHNELVCIKKYYVDLFQLLYSESVKLLKGTIARNDRGGIIKENEFTNDLLVKCFDQEHYTVCVVDENENFLYALCRRDMNESFCFTKIKKRRDVIVNDACDVLDKVVHKFLAQNEIEEIPVLREGKIIYFILRRERRELALQWDWIDEDVIGQMWNRGTKLLVSSISDEIYGFVNKFSHFFCIDVFNDLCRQKYLSGRYEALLYSTDVWNNAMTKKYNIKQLYLDCLSVDMLNWFEKKHIEYHYFEMPKNREIYQFLRRLDNISIISESNVEINGCYFQKDIQKEGFHVYGGRRITIGEPDIAQNTIYVFGPCIAIGSYVSDADTIESKLQCHINKMHLNYKVVNCGGGDSPYEIGNDINSFYIMANTKFKQGDLIIHFGSRTWKNVRMKSTNNYHKCANAFNERNFLDTKCFSDFTASHLNALGNSIIEQFIYSNIEKYLNTEKEFSEEVVLYAKNKKQINNDDLKKWIKELQKYKTSFQRVGCIVMNCNPFTRGHFYLIDKSRKEVDYLFVFIVEEEKSFFPFKERLEMAIRNCKAWNNVKVLSSGKYIISELTFEEYFSKDTIQGQTIFPALDIQIFAKYVAPTLGITVRFVGEEKRDLITAQYNKAMKELLPLDGVEIVEYPRLAIDGEVISASSVRECIINNKWDKLKIYLPDESYKYIVAKYKI